MNLMSFLKFCGELYLAAGILYMVVSLLLGLSLGYALMFTGAALIGSAIGTGIVLLFLVRR